ncbi:MAG: hypothetical protein LBM06_00645 [Prevotellaceae bacterium]|jgi:hypothetical protein|nr:hypothetical protein [Prevotellaceae bacterium]
MKRANRLYGLSALSLLMLVLAACSRQMDETDPEANNETGNYELITLSTVANQGHSEEAEEPTTRTVYTDNTNGMTVTWNASKPEEEVLQVFSYPTGKVEAPTVNRIYGLPGTLSNGNKTLQFSGSEIIRSADNKYHYLYPQPTASQVTKSGNNVVVNYNFSGQTVQVGSTTHLAAGDVMYSSARVGETQSFTFSRACALLRFVVKLPAGAPAINRLILGTSSAILYGGLQLTYAPDGSVSVKGTNESKSISVDITGDQTSTSQRTLTAYLYVSAKNASGNNTDISNQQIQIIAISGSTRYMALMNTTSSSQKLEPGKRFTFAPNAALVPVINLSQNAGANCYIVNKAGGFYSFNALQRGNGVEPTSAEYISSKPAGFSGTIPWTSYTSKILWSMGGSSSTSINGIINTLVYNNGIITFSTTDTPNNGNAVIALLDAAVGNIVWSWHIWKVDYDPYSTTSANAPKYGTHNYPINGYYNNKVVMMKYNLGAVKTQESFGGIHMYEYGLLYQWGRKDPFLGVTNNTGSTNPTDGTHFKSSGNPTFNYNAGADGTLGSISLAVSNPMNFYSQPVEDYDYDWHGARRINDLWGNAGTATTWGGSGSTSTINKEYGTKTCFDPCPPGYKVPPHGTWTRYFATEEMTTNSASKTPNVSGSFNKGHLFKYDNVNTTFYAATGYRSHTNGVAVSASVGTEGSLWSSSPNFINGSPGGYIKFSQNNISYGGYQRAAGRAIRCAKEN